MHRIIFLLLLSAASVNAQQKSKAYQSAKDSATAFMRNKQYDNALVKYRRSFTQGNDNLFDLYNAACAAALTQRPDEAFLFLNQAIDQGYMDKPWAEKDTDFNSIHDDVRWSRVIQKLGDQPRVMAQKFAAIKGRNPATLIPFKQNDRWGYLDKKSLMVVVEPAFFSLPFMNGCAEVKCPDGTTLWINSSGELIEVVHRNHGDEPTMEYALDDAELPHHVSSANGFKGFKMDENKRIIQFSDIYNSKQPDFFNIDGPIMINGKYYAIVDKRDGAGIIDEEGNPLAGFDFVHNEIVWNRTASGRDPWFYFKDKNGKTGFINSKGQKKLEGELIDYPFHGNNMFGYGIQQGNDSYGVIDLHKMEWVIKPQPLYIERADGTSKAECKKYADQREDMIDVYFLVNDKGEESEEYYIDRRMRGYRVKR